MNENAAVYLSRFIQQLKIEKRMSANTERNYVSDIRFFIKFVEDQEQESLLFIGVTPMFVRSYLAFLRNQGYAKTTIARRIAALRTFYHFLCIQGIVEDNPVNPISTRKIARKMPEYLDETQIKEILLLPSQSLLGIRDHAILEVLYATGIKVSELVSLSLTSFDKQDAYILVYGKGAKERIIPLGRMALAALDVYLTKSRPFLCAKQKVRHNVLFVNKFGGALTDRSVRRVISKYVEQLALNKHINPNLIRHTFAIHMLKNGADLISVQELLGHMNLTTTQIYAPFHKDMVQTIYNRTHPRA